MSRFWRYRYGKWNPELWQYFIPWFGGSDEYGRRVAIFHIPGFGFLCWAYKTCNCEDCENIREETVQMLKGLDD